MVDLHYNANGTTTKKYVVEGAFSGVISKRTANTLRTVINTIPQSWYIDKSYNIVRPKYRRNFTDYRVKLKDFVDYLDGTKKYIKEYTRTK
jgi:hypothetical protein